METLSELTKEFDYDITMKMMRCEECDARFAVSKTFISQMKSRGGTIFCPRGHKHKYESTKMATAPAILQESARV